MARYVTLVWGLAALAAAAADRDLPFIVGDQTAPVYHGKLSAMLTRPSSLPAQYRFWTSWGVGTTYTLSAYVKSGAAAAKFRLCLNGSRQPDLRNPKLDKDFKVGAE